MIAQIRDYYGGNVNKARKAIREVSATYPKHLIPVNAPVGREKIPPGFVGALRSRDFFVMVVKQGEFTRLTINRADVNAEGIWKDGITWDEIQRLKREAGFGDRLAVEVYPEDEHLVNDANMRHIFILPERPAFAWTSANRAKDHE